MQIEYLVYHIICGYVACVPECCGSVCCASQLRSGTIQCIGFVVSTTSNNARYEHSTAFIFQRGHFRTFIFENDRNGNVIYNIHKTPSHETAAAKLFAIVTRCCQKPPTLYIKKQKQKWRRGLWCSVFYHAQRQDTIRCSPANRVI
jgi:hypothetical protein